MKSFRRCYIEYEMVPKRADWHRGRTEKYCMVDLVADDPYSVAVYMSTIRLIVSLWFTPKEGLKSKGLFSSNIYEAL